MDDDGQELQAAQAPRGRRRGRRRGLVLAGGGARGAYEAGVCLEIFDLLKKDGGPGAASIEVISGTSAGALNACALAAHADDLTQGARLLCETWSRLRFRDLLRADGRRAWAMVRAALGHPPRRPSAEIQRGGLFDTAPLEQVLQGSIPFARISEHLAAQRLRAVALTATHLGTGRPTVFVEKAPGARVRRTPHMARVRLAPVHALASAAIPFLFPSVRIDEQLYCDGSLRHNVPLSAAIHLGCDALLIVNPRSAPSAVLSPEAAASFFPGPQFLFGKLFDALVLDRVDTDLERVEQLNALLAAGRKAFGPGFVNRLNRALVHQGGKRVRKVAVLDIRPSADLGQMAAAVVQSPAFRRRAGLAGRMLARAARGDAMVRSDMLSYLLFDSGFARELIELGRADARRDRDRLLAFFTD